MKKLPKDRRNLKRMFSDDQIELRKLNYLRGGDGGGEGSDPPWI